MNITFYTFAKRVNSTARPSSGGASYNVVLKSESSVISPHISLVWDGTSSPSSLNYAFIALYNRYYFVKNWTYSDRQWHAVLEIDVLASYKTQIGAANKYVLRSYSDYDPHVLDSLYPALSTTSESIRVEALASPSWENYGVGGKFVLTCIGMGQATASNNVSQYVMTGAELQGILSNILIAANGEAQDIQNAAYMNIGEALSTLLRAPGRFFTDLTEYIRGLMWFPFDFTGTAGTDVRVGRYICGSSKLITAPTQISSCDIDVSAFPASGSDDWEYLAPFTSYSLELQPFGVIDLDSVDVVNASTIRCITKVDSLSGLGLLRIYMIKAGSSVPRLVAARTAQVGVAVPLGGSSPNYAGAITGAMTVAATAAAYMSGNVAAPALAASIGSAVMSSAPSAYSAGTSGGGAGVEGVARLYIRKLNHAPLDVAEVGRPLCQFRTINTLTGYVQCRDGDIAIPATAAEIQAVGQYLTGGFFYE